MKDILPKYIRPVIFYSVVAGILNGVLLLLPIVQFLTLFLFCWMIGGIVVCLLRKNNFIGKFTQTEGIVIGSITGIVSTIVTSLIFVPFSIIVGEITNTASIGFLFQTSFLSSVGSVLVLMTLVIFIGLILALFNIGSSLLCIAFFNWLEQNKEEQQSEFKIEL